jgi:hypothetical protein
MAHPALPGQTQKTPEQEGSGFAYVSPECPPVRTIFSQGNKIKSTFQLPGESMPRSDPGVGPAEPSELTLPSPSSASETEAFPVGGVTDPLLRGAQTELLKTVTVITVPVLRVQSEEFSNFLIQSLRERQVEVGIDFSD